MENNPNFVLQLESKILDYFPSSIHLSQAGDLFILNSVTHVVSVYNFTTYEEKHRILFEPPDDFVKIWYMESIDAILILQRNQDTGIQHIWQLHNWRKSKVLIAKNAVCPNKWVFNDKIGTKFSILVLGEFQNNTFIDMKFFQKSLMIVSLNSATIWDFDGRPVFRTILVFPFQLDTNCYCFAGDQIAIGTNDGSFVLQIIEKELIPNDSKFEPGTKCLQLQNGALWLESGHEHDENNFVTVRSLPGRSFVVKTLFRYNPPGQIYQIEFIEKRGFVFVTSNIKVELIQITNFDNTFEFIQNPFSLLHDTNKLSINDNYFILHGNDTIYFLPNPSKGTSLSYTGLLSHIEKLIFKNILFVQCNQSHCFVLLNSTENCVLYRLSFVDINEVVQFSIHNRPFDIKVSCLHLLGRDHPEYPSLLYRIGVELLSKKKQTEALKFLVESFNVKTTSLGFRKQILESSRVNIIRKDFAFFANFVREEIDNNVLKDILDLNSPNDAMKLFGAAFYESNISLKPSYLAELYYEVVKIKNNCKIEYIKISRPESIKQMPTMLIQELSPYVSPFIRASMGFAGFNINWLKTEQEASYSYFVDDIKKSVILVCDQDQFEWHFQQWPKRPTLCNWLKMPASYQFVAGCALDFCLDIQLPNHYQTILQAISKAKSKEFSQALDLLKDRIDVLSFIKSFCSTPNDWYSVYHQVHDSSIRQYAQHCIFVGSPSKPYIDFIHQSKHSNPFADEIHDFQTIDDSILLSLSS